MICVSVCCVFVFAVLVLPAYLFDNPDVITDSLYIIPVSLDQLLSPHQFLETHTLRDKGCSPVSRFSVRNGLIASIREF